MNKMKYKPEPPTPKHAVGQVWADRDHEYGHDAVEYFLLCRITHNTFSAVSLEDGNRWKDPVEDISVAVGGLTFASTGLRLQEVEDE